MPTQFLNDAFQHLDLRNPAALLVYLGILGMLVYAYYNEGALVFREYGRLHREILKEPSLKPLYTEEWKQRLKAATHFFDLGNWLILASVLLLFQFVGLMILLQSTPGQGGDKEGASRPSVSLSTTVVVTPATPVEKAKAVVIEPDKDMGQNGSTTERQEPRLKAQRLLGGGFSLLCGFAVLWMHREKYAALRTMYEFSSNSARSVQK